MICADPQLASLDEQMAELYKAAIAKDKAASVKAAQQQWLRSQRNVCQDAVCLTKAYQQRLAELSPPSENAWSAFSDAELGIAFSYPSQRQISPNCHASKRCVALATANMPNQTEYVLAFDVFDGGLEQVATDQAVFSKNGSNWTAKGRNGEYPAEEFKSKGWQGIKAVVDCGVSDENGFHGAAGECLWAVLSNGKRTVVIDTQGLVGNDELSLRSIQSVQFLP